MHCRETRFVPKRISKYKILCETHCRTSRCLSKHMSKQHNSLKNNRCQTHCETHRRKTHLKKNVLFAKRLAENTDTLRNAFRTNISLCETLFAEQKHVAKHSVDNHELRNACQITKLVAKRVVEKQNAFRNAFRNNIIIYKTLSAKTSNWETPCRKILFVTKRNSRYIILCETLFAKQNPLRNALSKNNIRYETYFKKQSLFAKHLAQNKDSLCVSNRHNSW